MSRITVKHRHGRTFDIKIRGYALLSDEPVPVGDDEGPSPTELMVAGLAACAAEEAMRSLSDMNLPFNELEVEAGFSWDAAGERVGSVNLLVSLPPGLSDDAVRSVETAMLSCPARKMLTQPPHVQYDFTGAVFNTAPAVM